MSTSIKPGDDFFQFVNAEWLAANPIPADEAQWGSFYKLRFDVEEQLRGILDEIVAKENVVNGSDEQKVRDFYRSAMDMAKRNQLGISPLAEWFQEIDALGTKEASERTNDLSRVVGNLHRAGVGAFWVGGVGQDEKQSDVMAFQLQQGGLGLPDRDYYVNDDEKSKKIRADYLLYITSMLQSTSLEKDPAGAAAVILDIETRLARASLTPVELRDVEKMYNKMTLADFAGIAPNISLSQYFSSVATPSGSSAPEYIIVGQPEFFKEVSRMFSEISLDAHKTYLRWCILNNAASYLSEDFEKRSFDFYAQTFAGVKEMKPLWRRALRATDGAMEELLGKLYVAKYFPEEAKRVINDLVDKLVIAYRARIEKLDWMSDETKKKALEKLGTITRKLGYPDVWKDYSGLTIVADSFFENATRASIFEFDRKMKQVGGPVDRNEWQMPPQMVNACCDLVMNQVVFPAAILQPPLFDPRGDFAINLGATGATIGHELTHAFDDQGSRFDLHGNLKEWWTAEDKARFEAKAAQLAAQFDEYELFPGAHVNGKLTLGENIADLGGLLIAYDALKLAIAENPSLTALVNGKTPEQRLFIGLAICERGQYREERARLLLQVDPHSPAQFRVNGPVSNMTEFYEVFEVKPGDKLWRKPEYREKIW
jgi:predicted metalloendopeptidase